MDEKYIALFNEDGELIGVLKLGHPDKTTKRFYKMLEEEFSEDLISSDPLDLEGVMGTGRTKNIECEFVSEGNNITRFISYKQTWVY